MDSVLKYSSIGLQRCQIIWHRGNMSVPCSVSPSDYCPPLSFLLWTGTSCIVTRRHNIRRAGIPVPNPALFPGWNCPWEAAVPNETGTGLGWWLGSVMCRDPEGCWLLPKHWSHDWERRSVMVEPRKAFVDPKDAADIWIMRPLRWVRRIRNIYTVQYINIVCSAFFLPFCCSYLITASLTSWVKYS